MDIMWVTSVFHGEDHYTIEGYYNPRGLRMPAECVSAIVSVEDGKFFANEIKRDWNVYYDLDAGKYLGRYKADLPTE
jgi:hypothetical protein